MPKPQNDSQTRGKLRSLMDSPGLWLFLFAAFALLTLSIGEKKIQKRMQIYHNRIVPPASQKAESPKVQANAGAEVRDLPYIYELTGLRWIFGGIACVGLILFAYKGFLTFRPNSETIDPGEGELS